MALNALLCRKSRMLKKAALFLRFANKRLTFHDACYGTERFAYNTMALLFMAFTVTVDEYIFFTFTFKKV